MSADLLAHRVGSRARRRREVYYPDEDGKPMAETAPHVARIIYVYQVLRHWLRPREKACVHADMFFYPREGHPEIRVAPDVFVVWGVPQNEARRSYKLWEEKQAPQVIFEITSRKTQNEDLGKKRALYARLEVEEYYLFDPFVEYLDPPLCGYELAGKKYIIRPVENLPRPALEGNGTISLATDSLGWRLTSARLKLEIWALAPEQSGRPYIIRFYDPAAGKWLPDPDQAMIEREQFEKDAREAEARAEHEAMLRHAAEEHAAVEMQKRQAEAEARQAAEAELARVKAELEKLRSNGKGMQK